MIVGNVSLFAVESEIARAYERPSLRGLGYFIIHVGGRHYGVRAPEATMLACSFDATQKRIINRGRHTAPFSSQSDGGQIADAVRTALYADEQDNEHFLGLSQPELANLVYSNGLLWAPDGDEAFDDGSFVLQFDVGESVRLIAFKALRSSDKPYLHDPATLSDVWLPAETFYGVLQQWGETFEAAWKGLPKEPFGENTVH